MSTPTNDQNPNPNPPATPPSDDPVAPDVFRRTQADMFKHKQEAEALRTELSDLKLNSLKNAENWKEVAQVKESEAQAAKARLAQLEKALIDDKKYGAIKTEALAQGLILGAVEDIEKLDFPEALVETTSEGRIMVHGVKEAVLRLKTQKPFYFQNHVPSINPSGPVVTPPGSPTRITIDMINTAAAKYHKEKTPAATKEYEDIMRAYKTQK